MNPAHAPFVQEPLPAYREYPPAETIERAQYLYRLLAVRTTPSDANQQPWFFSVITNPEHRQGVRELGVVEVRTFYSERAPQEWLDAMAPLGTDSNKPFLEEAPVLIATFAQKHCVHPDGEKFSRYYVPEPVGIDLGFLIAALHHAGLATLKQPTNQWQ